MLTLLRKMVTAEKHMSLIETLVTARQLPECCLQNREQGQPTSCLPSSKPQTHSLRAIIKADGTMFVPHMHERINDTSATQSIAAAAACNVNCKFVDAEQASAFAVLNQL